MNAGIGRRAWIPIVALAAIGVFALVTARPQRHTAQRHEVEIRGLAFKPAELEVAAGDTVVWINHDIFPHTATSTRQPGWTTGIIPPDSSGRYLVSEATAKGEEPYYCELHPSMVGKLIVR